MSHTGSEWQLGTDPKLNSMRLPNERGIKTQYRDLIKMSIHTAQDRTSGQSATDRAWLEFLGSGVRVDRRDVGEDGTRKQTDGHGIPNPDGTEYINKTGLLCNDGSVLLMPFVAEFSTETGDQRRQQQGFFAN